MTFPHAFQPDLFGGVSALPDGFAYRPAFLSEQEERALLEAIAALPLRFAQYREYVAKRRIASFGSQYDFGEGRLKEAAPMPPFLLPLRRKAADWSGLPAESLAHSLITEYRPGTTLGWHRDAPDFEHIVGISLGATCRMRLRPWRPGEVPRRRAVLVLELAPRSAYLLSGPARWRWQHSIAPTRDLRYSITFRTVREAATIPSGT